MKKILFASLMALSMLSYGVAQAEPETKKACVKDAKTGKEVCKTIKVHKKLEGTKVPEKK